MNRGQPSGKTIFALGDANPQDDAINAFIISLAQAARPTVCFLGTASGDDADYVEKFTLGFSKLHCWTKHCSLFRLPTADLRAYILDTDIVYVGGGNTRSMLALWREWGLDAILREAWEAGIVLCGPSAGAICWFEQGTTDVIPGQINPIDCLGFLPGSCCPHYDGELLRRPAYLKMIEDGILKGGYAADDFVGLLFRDQDLAEVVSAREGSYAYRVERRDGKAIESILTPTLIRSS